MAEITIENGWCVGIRAKYIGPTDTLGSRWRVWRADETYANDPDAVTVGYRSDLNSGGDNAAAAIEVYLARKGDDWNGRWIVACGTTDSYVAVRCPR